MASHTVKSRFATYVGAAIFLWSVWYLIARVEWAPVIGVLGQANFLWLIFGGGMSAITYFAMRAWRLFLMARRVNAQVRYRDIYVMTAFILAFSDMTPGKLGEALKVEMLKRLGLLGRLEGTGAFLVERVLDLLVVASLGIASMVLSRDVLPGGTHVQILVAVTFALSAIALWLFLGPKTLEKFRVPMLRLRAAVSDRRTMLMAAVLTVCAWMIVAMGWQLSLRSIAIELSLLQSVWLVCVTGIVVIASFVPGGLGISEIVIAEVLEYYGVGRADALAGAIILRCFGLLGVGLGLLHWFFLKHVGETRLRPEK